MLATKNEALLELILKIIVILTVGLFLAPSVFMWIWNWQFGDIYVFSFWKAFWLAIAVRMLLQLGTGGKND